MKTLTFYLQFHRPPKPAGAGGGGGDPPAIAQSGALASIIGPDGVTARWSMLPGATARLDNSFALNQDGSMFFEWGTVTFGEGAPGADQIQFTSIGPGYLLGPQDPSSPMQQGAVMWKITGGSGAFAGARGAIVSNFLVDVGTGELVDNHLYLVYLPG